MAPRVQRTAPPYVQITDHFRDLITRGVISEGHQLPTVQKIAKEWGVSPITVSKALRQLQVEGLVRTSTQGTFATSARAVLTGQDHVTAIRTTGEIYPPDQTSEIRAASLVDAPDYVADILGAERGVQVIRRERVTSRSGQPIELSVSWLPAVFAGDVPELIGTERIPGGTAGRIAAVLGRHVTHGTELLEARTADEREASALGLPVGTAVLAAAVIWRDDQGVIEYGEAVRPPKRTCRFEYTVDLQPGAPDDPHRGVKKA